MPMLTIGQSVDYKVNTDLEPSDLPLSIFTDGENFKLTSKGITTFNGSKLLSTPPAATTVETWDAPIGTWDDDLLAWEAGEPTKAGLVVYVPGTLESYYAVLCRNKVLTFDGSNWGSISPGLEYLPLSEGSESLWTACKLGQAVIFNNPQSYPLYWQPTLEGNPLKPLDFSPTQTWKAVRKRANVVRSHKNFLFALNLREGATELPTSYRWSHPADINGLPFTWDETDLSAIAGIASIEGSGGNIVDGLSLRDTFVIYAERAIYLLSFTGDEFVWRIRPLTESYGLLSTNCVVEVKGIHYFMTDSDIMYTDGNSVESLLYNMFQRKFVSTLSKKNYKAAFAVANYSTKEIWFCYPSATSVPDKAVVYNWVNKQISFRDLPGIVSAAVGPTLTSSETWDSSTGSWDEDTLPWNTAFSTYFDYNVVGISSTGKLSNLEINAVNEPYNTVIEKLSFPVSNEPNTQASTINIAYPRIRCSGKVAIQFGVQDDFYDDINWGEALEFMPDVSKQVEPRSGSGKYHSFRIFSSEDRPFTFVGMQLSIVTRGSR